MDRIPSDAILIVIRTALEMNMPKVHAADVRDVLQALGYCNFRCGYLQERFHKLSWRFTNKRKGGVMDKTVTFIVKANVSKMAQAEGSTEDQIIETITDDLTKHTGDTFGTECWLDDVEG